MILASPATMAARSVARFAGRPAIAGLLVAIAMLAAPIVSGPLNRLSSPFALLIVLPPLALALDAYGWSAQLAAPLRRMDPREGAPAGNLRGLAGDERAAHA